MRAITEHQGYGIRDLAATAGVSVRLVRDLKETGYLPGPLRGRTRSAIYGAEHLRLLNAYKRLHTDGRPTRAELAERRRDGLI